MRIRKYNISNEYNKIYHCNILNVANKDLIMTFIQYHISHSSTISNLEICLDNIKNCNWHNKNRTVQFWMGVNELKDSISKNPFQDLALFAIKLLSFQYSNAEDERTFSAMNLCKSKIRNRLSLNSVNTILHIKHGLHRKDTCCNK